MEIQNKDILLKCARKSINAVSKAGANCASDEDAYYVIGTAVHWIVDCIERIPPEKIKNEDKKIFSAIKCVNNCLKHNVTYKEAHKIEGGDFPCDFPFDFGATYIWVKMDEVKIPHKIERQLINYNSELQGKNVLTTLNKIYDIVQGYYTILEER